MKTFDNYYTNTSANHFTNRQIINTRFYTEQ